VPSIKQEKGGRFASQARGGKKTSGVFVAAIVDQWYVSRITEDVGGSHSALYAIVILKAESLTFWNERPTV
jgi:hypothetical protein